MFFENMVPPKARGAYRKDTWSGMLGAVMSAATLPFVAVIARDKLKASELQMALLSMAPAAGSLLLLFWANAMEGRRKMPFALWPWVVSRSALALAVFAITPDSFVGMMAVFYLVGSVAGPPYVAIIREIYPERDRARIMAYARVCTICVMTIITLGAGYLLKIVDYRYVFPVAAVFGIASAVVFSRIHTSESTGDPATKITDFIRNSVNIYRQDRAFRWFCDGIFIFGAVNCMAQPIYAIYQVDVLHVDTRWASLYSAINGIIAMVGYIYWGTYVDRKSPLTVAAICTVIAVAMPVSYCIATQAWMLIPLTVIGGIMNTGFELSYFNGVLHYAPREKVTMYQSMFSILYGIRGMAAPFIGGWLVESHFRGMISPHRYGSFGAHVLSMKAVFILVLVGTIISVIVQYMGIRKFGTKPRYEGGL